MRFDMSDPDERATGLMMAAGALRRGELVALPTETVYGLGADATNARAVAAIFAAKGRPSFNPLIIHVPDLAAARQVAEFDQKSLRLAERFWPGPLTLVLRKAKGSQVAELATAGLDTVAVRIPSHPIALDLLKAFGRPVAAPSANLSGRVSPTSADHVVADLAGSAAVILDGGPAAVGVESTIVAASGGPAFLLRPGGVAREDIEAAIGEKLGDLKGDADAPAAPGMLASHYAPRASVRLNAAEVMPGEALLAFGKTMPPGAEKAAATINLSASGDLTEAAAALFGALRALDAEASAIAVMPIPDSGLGEAINDRLRRAAAPRPSA